ncbi:unnamed protein product [Protopolystoma xenopodis]|uniref:Uncharacterized protein n=1 Tax=Protopolystoma xenopodis TaxID=117903 RepID=A0A3S5CQB4_9PLAT|nr:unnamed protein product [Protopolystoma xenopodis]
MSRSTWRSRPVDVGRESKSTRGNMSRRRHGQMETSSSVQHVAWIGPNGPARKWAKEEANVRSTGRRDWVSTGSCRSAARSARLRGQERRSGRRGAMGPTIMSGTPERKVVHQMAAAQKKGKLANEPKSDTNRQKGRRGMFLQ